jgi:hypothetical protein
VDFQMEVRFDNFRAVQVCMPGFLHERLVEVGRKILDVHAADSWASDRILSLADESIGALAIEEALAGASLLVQAPTAGARRRAPSSRFFP